MPIRKARGAAGKDDGDASQDSTSEATAAASPAASPATPALRRGRGIRSRSRRRSQKAMPTGDAGGG